MKLKEVLDKTTQFFKDKKLDTPRLDAELLLAHGLGLERIQLYLKFDQPLNETDLQTCRDLVKRRSLGEPVAYIVGYKDFYGLRFKVSPAVLIPRPETEHIVEAVVTWAKNKSAVGAEPPISPQILDLGCGSGCIGQTILHQLPQAQLTAVDISEASLDLARQNAETLGLLDRNQFILGDAVAVEAEMNSKFDVIVANPPYIAIDDPHVEKDVKKFEPEIALFAGENGREFLKAWSAKYKDRLKPKSLMLMEMGFDQGPAMKNHFVELGIFSEVRIIKDLSNLDRIICGVKNG